MVLKKSPVNKTDEELLKELETAKDNPFLSQIEREEDEIISFLRYFNLEPGDYTIRDSEVYRLYKLYSSTPLIRKTFYYYLNKYLIRIASKYYKINKSAANLDDKVYELLEEQRKKDLFKVQSWHKHFQHFVEKYNLKAGGEEKFLWIEDYILYDLYDQWVYSIKKGHGLSKFNFDRFCCLYFPEYQRIGRFQELVFKLDHSIIKHFTAEKISALREARKAQRGKTKPKKK